MERTGQVALITGAGRGIGRALAISLAHHGVKTMLSARTSDALEETAASVRQAGGEASIVTADLLDCESPERLINATIDSFGRIDVLINNAGVLLVKPFADTSLEEFDQLMTVNLRAPFALIKAALPHLTKSDSPVVINIASASGKRFYPNQSVYCASKHGLLGLNKVLASEFRDFGIRVHAICPGGVATDMSFSQRPDWSPEDLMAPEDIADAVIALLSMSGRATIDELPIRRIAAEPIWG